MATSKIRILSAFRSTTTESAEDQVEPEPHQEERSAEAPDDRLMAIPLDQLERNPSRPRSTADEEQLEELITAILQEGLIQPIAVHPTSASSYQIVAGHRRRIGAAREPNDITEADIESYRDSRLNEVTPTTVNREMDCLRALLGHAKKQGIISRNPAEAVKPPKLRIEPKGWLRSNEIAPFLDECSVNFAPIAKFTIFTGLRRREVIFLPAGGRRLPQQRHSSPCEATSGFPPQEWPRAERSH